MEQRSNLNDFSLFYHNGRGNGYSHHRNGYGRYQNTVKRFVIEDRQQILNDDSSSKDGITNYLTEFVDDMSIQIPTPEKETLDDLTANFTRSDPIDIPSKKNQKKDILRDYSSGCERKLIDPDMSAIETKLFSLAGKYDHPTILIIGRGNGGYFTCEFETMQTSKFSEFKILSLDICEKSMPDIVADFDDHNERINVGRKIKSMGCNIVLIQFDYSVLKYIKNLPSLFSDVCEILVEDGMFIVPHEIAGGGIIMPMEESNRALITELNCITIPFSLIKEMLRPNDDSLFKSFKEDVICQSQDLILSKLGEIFKCAEMHTRKQYPFFENLVCTYYVCSKKRTK